MCSCILGFTPPVVEDDLPELPDWTYERQLVQLSVEEKGRLPAIGTRVKRGADWKWGNEDGYGPGTIVGHKDNGRCQCIMPAPLKIEFSNSRCSLVTSTYSITLSKFCLFVH